MYAALDKDTNQVVLSLTLDEVIMLAGCCNVGSQLTADKTERAFYAQVARTALLFPDDELVASELASHGAHAHGPEEEAELADDMRRALKKARAALD